jgi:hypothetical protein
LRKAEGITKPPRKQRADLRLVTPPPAPAPDSPLIFDLAEWAPIDEAYARVKAALKSRVLAEHDTLAHLRDGRFNSAARSVRRDGVHTFGLLWPALWRGLTIREGLTADPTGMPVDSGRVRVTACDAEAAKLLAQARVWWFFVLRRDLDSYPGGGEEQAADARRQAPLTGRKPGPPPTHDWHTVVAGEVIRRVAAGAKFPTIATMIKHCETVLPGRYSPGHKEMQILLQKLRRLSKL